jgi:hypothetical protein
MDSTCRKRVRNVKYRDVEVEKLEGEICAEKGDKC